MDPINDARFYESLIKPPHLRTPDDVRNIYEQLRQLDMFATLYNAPLKAICASARYERHAPQHVLFREGQVATCWYILLSGSVLISNHIYMPFGCFGKRNSQNYRRNANCIVLQESEMIVIDYPDVQRISVGATVTATTSSVHGQLPPLPHHALKRVGGGSHPSLEGMSGPPPVPPRPARIAIHPQPPPPLPPARPPPRGLPRSYQVDFPVDVPSTSFTTVASIGGVGDNHRSQVFVNGVITPPASERGGTTGGAVAANDDESTLVRVKHRREKSNSIGGSSQTAGQRAMRVRSTASSSTTEDAPSSSHGAGTMDSEDEDEESCPSHDSFVELKDSVRECLEKEPGMRNGDDLAVLLDFMQHMSAFASLPMSIKRQLCLKMVFAVVNEAGTIVMQNGERLDAWSVIVNGQVEVVKPNGERVEYKLGDWFGCEASSSPQYHVGDMRTVVDDCEFVLVEHKDYYSIMSTLAEHIEKDRDVNTGEIVSETEKRTVGNQVGLVLIKGKPDKLVAHLVDDRDSSIDPHYVDDFLLTYRVFIHNSCSIFERLMMWFAEQQYRDRVARIVLLWVNNHHNDFETSDEMTRLLTRFEAALERDGMHSQQSLLNIACSVKARPREMTLSRQKDDSLPFVMVGGKEVGTGIFVSHVDTDSTAEKAGIRRGDEVLEVNGLSIKYATLARANELARSSLQLRLLIKSNVLGFKELVARNAPESVISSVAAAKARTKAVVTALSHPRGSMPNVKPLGGTSKATTMKANGGGVMDKLMTMLKSTKIEGGIDETDERAGSLGNELRASRSNPDLANSIAHYYGPVRSDSPEHVLKIYRADQTFKYLPVYKETTAQNVVQLALQEFGMTAEGSLEWSLCETSVTSEKVIKQRRLPPQMENLAERIPLNSRYYLKNNSRSDPLVPDELAPELLKEAQCQFLDLDAHVVACQLTLQDFSVFSSIEPTEYVDNLFQLESRYGWARLTEFENLFNREMWWVCSEVCSERSSARRGRLIKKFIKVARFCRDLRNFNSMFAIYSGLQKPAVKRLVDSWSRVPSKCHRWLHEIEALMDPSRNMSRYRGHLSAAAIDPPAIPIYPVFRKDLTFMHEGNPTYTDKLVNFDKLRRIARAVRGVGKLSSSPYEIGAMAERSGGTLNDALLHMNTWDKEHGGAAVATMRKAARGGTQPRKKIYEQALMVRKVKTYLAELKVVESETELDSLSMEAEPPINGATGHGERREMTPSSGGPPSRRPISGNGARPPSPTPSSLSSHSAPSSNGSAHRFIGAKFGGIESPQAVQKMMALAKGTRTKERPAPLPPGHPSSHYPSGSGTLGREPKSPHPRGVHRVHSRGGREPAPPPPPPSLPPTDLNAESSSVTGFFNNGGVPIQGSHSVPFDSTFHHPLPPPSPSSSTSSSIPHPPHSALYRNLLTSSGTSSRGPTIHGSLSQATGAMMGGRPIPFRGPIRRPAIRLRAHSEHQEHPATDEDNQISRV